MRRGQRLRHLPRRGRAQVLPARVGDCAAPKVQGRRCCAGRSVRGRRRVRHRPDAQHLPRMAGRLQAQSLRAGGAEQRLVGERRRLHARAAARWGRPRSGRRGPRRLHVPQQPPLEEQECRGGPLSARNSGKGRRVARPRASRGDQLALISDVGERLKNAAPARGGSPVVSPSECVIALQTRYMSIDIPHLTASPAIHACTYYYYLIQR
mmetsp:Transcript_8851/g.28495  ORF Transcript_8851/g.28495 Transcript_8851/m.28495 type:complete len:209 (-) Transcript_8851:527-1153(-)